MLQGRATPAGTARYAARFDDRVADGHFRTLPNDVTAASIGMGTYLGDADDTTDTAYESAVGRALALGCNTIDTAVNYRFQRSERAIGRALAAAVASGDIQRDEIVISSFGTKSASTMNIVASVNAANSPTAQLPRRA